MKNIGFFVLSVLLWWFVAAAVGGAFVSSRDNLILGIGFIIFFGSLYAVPVIFYLALADVWASLYPNRIKAFAILALIGIVILLAVEMFWLRRALQFNSIVHIPTLAVIGLYLLKQVLAQRK